MCIRDRCASLTRPNRAGCCQRVTQGVDEQSRLGDVCDVCSPCPARSSPRSWCMQRSPLDESPDLLCERGERQHVPAAGLGGGILVSSCREAKPVYRGVLSREAFLYCVKA